MAQNDPKLHKIAPRISVGEEEASSEKSVGPLACQPLDPAMLAEVI